MCKRSLILYIVGSTDDATLGTRIRGERRLISKATTVAIKTSLYELKTNKKLSEIKLPKHRFP
jgi:hypothetical protein